MGDPWGSLGGSMGDPWRTLGGSSEELWWTLEDDCGKHRPPHRHQGCQGVYTYIGRKNEVCVHVEIAKVCIHVPAPKSAVCVKDQIAKVCIRVPGPETEVCAKPYNRMPRIWASSIRFAVVTPKCSYVPWGDRWGALGGDPWETLGGPLGDLWGTLEGRLGDPRKTFRGPLRGPCLGGTLGAHPCGTLGGPLEYPRRTLGGSLVDPGGPWEELRTLPPRHQGCQGVYTRTSA